MVSICKSYVFSEGFMIRMQSETLWMHQDILEKHNRRQRKGELTKFSRVDDKLHCSLEVIPIHDFCLGVLLLKLIKLLLQLPVVVEGEAVVPPKAPGAGIVVCFVAGVVQRQVHRKATNWENTGHQQVCCPKLDQFLKQKHFLKVRRM